MTSPEFHKSVHAPDLFGIKQLNHDCVNELYSNFKCLLAEFLIKMTYSNVLITNFHKNYFVLISLDVILSIAHV
jgi:hypothetical protein